MRNLFKREDGGVIVIILVVLGVLFLLGYCGSDANAAATKVTICHATGSESNPFVVNSPSAAGVYNGHIAHQHSEDIIPPFQYKGETYSQNWDAEGQAIWNNGCEVPTESPTPSPTVSPSPSESPSPSPSESPTPTSKCERHPDKCDGPDKPGVINPKDPGGTAMTGNDWLIPGALALGLGVLGMGGILLARKRSAGL